VSFQTKLGMAGCAHAHEVGVPSGGAVRCALQSACTGCVGRGVGGPVPCTACSTRSLPRVSGTEAHRSGISICAWQPRLRTSQCPSSTSTFIPGAVCGRAVPSKSIEVNADRKARRGERVGLSAPLWCVALQWSRRRRDPRGSARPSRMLGANKATSRRANTPRSSQ
jgi:hypothetical protein